MQNRPTGRKTNVTGVGKPIRRRGTGLGTGQVGHQSGYAGRRPTYTQSTGGNAGYHTTRAVGRRSPLIVIIAIVVIAAIVFGGRSCGHGIDPGAEIDQGFDLSSLFGTTSSVGGISTGWNYSDNTGKLNELVSPYAREKRTQILGNGRDTVTVMVYMCGSDLESNGGMGSYDIQEMCGADIGSGVNVILFTGGASKWHNSFVSSSTNQIYKVEKNGVLPLEKNAGSGAMTDPATLTGFINYCAENYPANRNELILWDHGGGSISGYGYDEKNPNAGSMNLQRVSKALFDCDVSFDFIGFDACLMGTLETALTLSPYADYLIASEETEPGIGWYYTNWLDKLSDDTSMPTVKIGKNIIDDFVTTCASNCRGQKATLSIIDLAELEKTVPADFRSFSVSTSGMMEADGYKTVSDARSASREFAASSKSDQVDLVDFAVNLGTDEGRRLADTVLSAVKYNRTSADITNAHGISIYFPYQKLSKVDSAVAAYDALGLEKEYSRCIQQFASLEAGGQSIAYGSSSPLSSVLGASSGGSMMSSDMIGSLLGGLFGGNASSSYADIGSLLGGFGSFLGSGIDAGRASAYLADNRFDPAALVWSRSGSDYVLSLTEEQWSLVHDIELNVFYDDGEGYIDLGLDNVFEFTDSGALLGRYDGTWLAINGQPVAYYHMDTVDDGKRTAITGRVPVLLNGSRADLLIVFDYDDPYGYIAGALMNYADGETDTLSKVLPLENGDVIDYVCDYYTYGGEYIDSYLLGERYVYDGAPHISNVIINTEGCASAMYMITDIYNNEYWTPTVP